MPRRNYVRNFVSRETYFRRRRQAELMFFVIENYQKRAYADRNCALQEKALEEAEWHVHLCDERDRRAAWQDRGRARRIKTRICRIAGERKRELDLSIAGYREIAPASEVNWVLRELDDNARDELVPAPEQDKDLGLPNRRRIIRPRLTRR